MTTSQPTNRSAPLGTSGPLPHLREATPADIAAVVDLTQAAYRGAGGWTTEKHLVDGARTEAGEVAAMLADPAVSLLVAEIDGEIAGCCYTRREEADAGVLRAELGLFAVDPRRQSRGIGARLLEAHAARLAAAGYDVLTIQVLQSRPELTAWYERHGFRAVGRSVGFAGDPALLKVPGLGMDVMERALR